MIDFKAKKRRFIAPITFYRLVFSISVPIIIQQVIQNTLGAVDTVMVATIGGVAAVSVGAQIENVMNQLIYGLNAGASIYAAQYYGVRDIKSFKKTFGLQLMLSIFVALVFILIVILLGRQVLSFYAPSDGKEQIIAQGLAYLSFALFSYLPASIIAAFSYTYRNIQKTLPPLVISILVMLINVTLNYGLIFGRFGLPKMGIQGASLATAIATFVGMMIHIIYAYQSKQPFIGSFKELFTFDLNFAQPILKKMTPIALNELLFGIGMTLYIKAFGLMGRQALESYKIGTTVATFFFPVVSGMNAAAGSILGNELGKGKIKKAKEFGNYFIFICLMASIVVTILIFLSADIFVPGLFQSNVSKELIQSSIFLTKLFSLRISIRLFNTFIFASLRAGGDSRFLLFLDGGIMFAFGLPICFIAVLLFGVSSVPLLFAINQIEQVIRLIIGMIRYQKGKWLKTLVKDQRIEMTL